MSLPAKKNKKLIVFSSPSGAGKTTIVQHLLKSHPDFAFSISACTRPKRNGEADGKDYYFLSAEEFKKAIENEQFLEWEQVYKGNYYGTLKSELERIWKEGKQTIFDVDVKGALNIKKVYGERALTIFIKAPSLQVLEERLKKRSTEGTTELEERIKRAKMEMEYEPHFDKVVLNDDFNKAIAEAGKVVENFLSD